MKTKTEQFFLYCECCFSFIRLPPEYIVSAQRKEQKANETLKKKTFVDRQLKLKKRESVFDMGLMNVNVVKNIIKMPSNCRHLCLFILLLSVVNSLISAEYQSDGGGNGYGYDQRVGPPVLQFKTKNNNRDLSEISVRKPQQTHHHHHHHHEHHQHHPQQQQQQLHQTHQFEPHHHLRHQFRSRSQNGIHHKQQHNHHQSNDSAYNRVPSYERQDHSPKNYAQNDDNYAPASRVGAPYHLTTMGPYRANRPYGRSWSVPNEKKSNWADNLSRNRQAPYENTHSSISRNRTINPYMRSHHSPRHPTTTTITAPTSTTTTTTTTTTPASTLAPDMPEKMFFDVQSSFNNIESGDNFDYDFDSSETYDTKKRSPPSGGGSGVGIGSFDRVDRLNQPNSENNFQHDDPVRSSSSSSSSYNNNNGTTTSVFKPQHSSNGDNYQLNVNNDGSTNTNQRPATTIDTSKSLGNDVKTSNLMTRNAQTRVSA